jgi:hypothetical protein
MPIWTGFVQWKKLLQPRRGSMRIVLTFSFFREVRDSIPLQSRWLLPENIHLETKRSNDREPSQNEAQVSKVSEQFGRSSTWRVEKGMTRATSASKGAALLIRESRKV